MLKQTTNVVIFTKTLGSTLYSHFCFHQLVAACPQIASFFPVILMSTLQVISFIWRLLGTSVIIFCYFRTLTQSMFFFSLWVMERRSCFLRRLRDIINTLADLSQVGWVFPMSDWQVVWQHKSAWDSPPTEVLPGLPNAGVFFTT